MSESLVEAQHGSWLLMSRNLIRGEYTECRQICKPFNHDISNRQKSKAAINTDWILYSITGSAYSVMRNCLARLDQQFSPRLVGGDTEAKASFRAWSVPVSALLGHCSTAVTPADETSSRVAQCRQDWIWRRRNAPMSCANTPWSARCCNRSNHL